MRANVAAKSVCAAGTYGRAGLSNKCAVAVDRSGFTATAPNRQRPAASDRQPHNRSRPIQIPTRNRKRFGRLVRADVRSYFLLNKCRLLSTGKSRRFATNPHRLGTAGVRVIRLLIRSCCPAAPLRSNMPLPVTGPFGFRVMPNAAARGFAASARKPIDRLKHHCVICVNTNVFILCEISCATNNACLIAVFNRPAGWIEAGCAPNVRGLLCRRRLADV